MLVAFFAYSIGYFCLLGYVMLRGLPDRAPRRRVVWTYMTSVLIGILCGALVLMFQTYAVVVIPLLLFAVPAIAAGDVGPAGALSRSAGLAVRNFARTWAVWLITVFFSAPVVLAMLLIVSAFADNTDLGPGRPGARRSDRVAVLGALPARALRRPDGPRRRRAAGPHRVEAGTVPIRGQPRPVPEPDRSPTAHC